jgi:putative ABC transport system substrate-binding protein
VNRRGLLIIGVGAAAWPLAARAQQKAAMPVIGCLIAGPPDPSAQSLTAFRQGLGEAGYVEGQNVVIEYRWAEGHFDRLPALAAELVARNVDVIEAGGGGTGALAAKGATSSIPIVFIYGGNPVELGLVASLARPGGNLTGVSMMVAELVPKRLELLSELVPQAKLIAVLANPHNPSAEGMVRDMHEAAHAKRLQILEASTEREIDAAFASLASMRAGALVSGRKSRR